MEYFQENLPHKEQLGIVRTNCLDSLDRTNVVQSRIAWRILKQQLSRFEGNLESCYADDGNKFNEKFKNLWVGNGNNISIQYTGTESISSDMTKGSKEGFFGSLTSKFNSVNRFIQNNFEDDHKQKCIDCFLGKGEFKEMIVSIEPMTKSVLKFFVVTWNLNGFLPESTINFAKLFESSESPYNSI